MNREPCPAILEQARCEATDFGAKIDSTEVLVAAVCALARSDPRQARQAIETVAAHLDEATQGKRTDELARLETAALQALGLDSRHMVAAADDRPEDGSAQDGPVPPEKQS